MRRVWVQVHLWLGLTFGVVGILLGITGSLLVFDHALDARLNPQRYAVSGEAVALPYTTYFANATQALGDRARPVALRAPDEAGMPLTIFARAREGGGNYRVYLDPPSGRVLEVARGGSGLVGWAHDLHGSLMLRQYAGREIVGAVGVAMLISALSGLYLWWPRGARRRAAFGMRPGFTLARNLHYLFGLYGAAVLAMLSLTGVLISFPDAARSTAGAFAAISPPPTAGPRGAYRVSLPGPDGSRVLFIDPRSGAILPRAEANTRTPADRFLAFMRPLHEGTPLGLPGRILICVAGLLPGLLAITGALLWLRQRRRAGLS